MPHFEFRVYESLWTLDPSKGTGTERYFRPCFETLLAFLSQTPPHHISKSLCNSSLPDYWKLKVVRLIYVHSIPCDHNKFNTSRPITMLSAIPSEWFSQTKVSSELTLFCHTNVLLEALKRIIRLIESSVIFQDIWLIN